jgi:hypothetical protein
MAQSSGAPLLIIIMYLIYKKRAIWLITNSDRKEPCRKLFQQLTILTFYSQYIFSIICFVIKNENIYVRNVDIHSRNNLDFLITSTNLTIYQKSTYYMGQKIFNSVPSYIKEEIHNVRKFRRLLKNFLYCKNVICWMNILITKKGKWWTCLLS